MTLRLSDHKVSLLLHHLFAGRPQEAVAAKVGATQSSVSLWFSRLKFRAGKIGLLEAGKEFGIMHQLESLRSLAVELFKNHLTVEDAKQGLSIIRALLALGVVPGQHKDLVRVCRKVAEPGFVPAALELSRLEAIEGTSYEQVLSQFKQFGAKVEDLKAEASGLSSQLSAVKKSLGDKKAELGALDVAYAKKKQDLADGEKKMEEALVKKMASVNVTAQEIEIVRHLKGDLAKKGIGLDALVSLATEFRHAK